MKHLVAFPLEDGGSIIVEVNGDEERGARRASRGTEGEPEPAPQTFEHALSKIRPATEKVITTLRTLVQKPDEVEMAFGFNLHAEIGVIIAKSSVEANYTVTLHWKGATEQSQ